MHSYQNIAPVVIFAAQVVPCFAQNQQLSVDEYIQTQQALIRGVTELLRLPTIAEDPNDVAVAIDEVSKYAAALVSLKRQLNAEELAAAQVNLESDPVAQMEGASFIAEVNRLSGLRFYDSARLASALQNFAELLAQM